MITIDRDVMAAMLTRDESTLSALISFYRGTRMTKSWYPTVADDKRLAGNFASWTLYRVTGRKPTDQAMASVGSILMKTQRTLTIGNVEGQSENGVEEYLGIPFAPSTAAGGRWRAPGLPPEWSGLRDATQYANDPIQPLEPSPFRRASGFFGRLPQSQRLDISAA